MADHMTYDGADDPPEGYDDDSFQGEGERPPARPQQPRRERTAIHPAYNLGSDTEAAPPIAAESYKIHGSPYALLLALSKARAEFTTVAADSIGQFQTRHFKYADLSSIYSAAIPALSKHGIAVFHPNSQGGSRMQVARTILAGHEAMIEVACEFPGSLNPDNVKGYGSMLTYINRYQLRGLVAVAGDDDPDSNGNQGTRRWNEDQERPRQPPRQQPRPQQSRAQDKPVAKPEPQERNAERRPTEPPTRPATVPPPRWDGPGLSPDTAALITAKLEELKIDRNEGSRLCRERTGRSAGTLHEAGGEAAALAFLGSLS